MRKKFLKGQFAKWKYFLLSGVLSACGANHHEPQSKVQEFNFDPVEEKFLTGNLQLSELSRINQETNGRYLDIERILLDERSLPNTDLEAIEKVTREFGKSQIDVSKLPFHSQVMDSGHRPWSSWWYPNFETTLFRSAQGDSPLQKYDAVRNYLYEYRRRPAPVPATSYEERNYNAQSLRWEGLCNAWAFASLFSKEPIETRTYYLGNRPPVHFTPVDFKALLLKTFEAVPDAALKIYGQKFTGEFNGWVHPDIFPDQLHRFVEMTLGTHKRAFIMDHDPGVEIWNVPVFKANYSVFPVEGREDAVRVRLWLYTASPLMKAEMNRLGAKETVREYQYLLFGKRVENRLEVESGMWIVGTNGTDSRRSHPDYLIDIPEPSKMIRQSFNKAIEVEVVDALIRGETIR